MSQNEDLFPNSNTMQIFARQPIHVSLSPCDLKGDLSIHTQVALHQNIYIMVPVAQMFVEHSTWIRGMVFD